MRIILVDDEYELISTLSERLLMRGIEADYVTSGRKALEAVREKSYDLAVIDIKMAGIDGLETIERIRSDFPDMAFIILTGRSDEETYCRGKDAGAAFYLTKPIDIEILIQKIHQAVGKKTESA